MAPRTSTRWLQLPNKELFFSGTSHLRQETVSMRKNWRTPCWSCLKTLQKDLKMMRNTHTHWLEETPCEVQRHIPKMQDLGDTRGGRRRSWKRKTRKRKASSTPTRDEVTTCSLIIRWITVAIYAKGRRAPVGGVRLISKKLTDGSALARKFGNLTTAEHKVLSLSARNESRCGHRNASIVQEEYTSWIESC